MFELDLADVLSIVLANSPDIEGQKAMVDKVESLMAEGMEQSEAVELVLGHLVSAAKPH
ncbi:hypothetical protein [Bowmanella denitrificans]|uniref:hypothetical protein n=1 Tax=Bowmanella denitrificans TaxID=366582 RepID=UPI0015585F07|nr:hypothetical protein [Bowmanella denitrificans]